MTAKENDIIPDYVHSATRVNHIIIVEKTLHELNELQEKVKNTIKYRIE